MITIAYYALVKKSEVAGGDDASEAHWFPIDNVPPLAFDHDRILRVALKTLKEKIRFMPIGFELLPSVFTMPQLQELYESILEVKFDRRNFSYRSALNVFAGESCRRDYFQSSVLNGLTGMP